MKNGSIKEAKGIKIKKEIQIEKEVKEQINQIINNKNEKNNKNKYEQINNNIYELNKNIKTKIINNKRKDIISFIGSKIFQYIILSSLLNLILTNTDSSLIESYFPNITLKIRGIGNKYLLDSYNKFQRKYYPNIIYINGERQSTINNSYNFNQTDNIVELIWFNAIDNGNCMFFGCSDITEIDLSNFDTSNVTYMGSMFSGCSSLSSLNLSNFNTSKVTSMSFMFNGCSSLTSLNLSNFDTSKVIDMYNIFRECKNLEYINLKNFIEKESLSLSSLFQEVPDNIVVCLNENSNKILSELKNKGCYTIDCSDEWKTKQKKIVNKTDICYDNNNNNILFKYEYKGKYYEDCINNKNLW